MTYLLPSLEFRDLETGRCVKPFDNCLTLAAVRNTPGWRNVKDYTECEECCPSCEDPGNYTGRPEEDGAWWFGSGDPAAEKTIGMIVDSVELEPSASVRRVGETSLQPPPYSPRLLVIEGRILSTAREGTYFLQQQLLELFQNQNGSQDGWSVTLRPFCPEVEPTDPTFPDPFDPGTLPTLLDDPDACGPCDREDPTHVHTLLTDSLVTQTSTDNGRRTSMRVRFLSMDTAESDLPVEYCFGADVRIVFEVFEDSEWGDPIEGVCDLSRGWDTFGTVVADGDEDPFVRCRPYDWTNTLIIPEGGELCIDDPQRPQTLATVESVRAAQPLAGDQYCFPLYRSVRACLTPTLPTSADVLPGFTINSGGGDLRNMMIEFFPAFNGYASPETCPGERWYRNMVPCHRAMIPWLQANSSITSDPRRQQVLMSCLGGLPQRAESSVEGWSHPALEAGCRYWIVVTTDCLNTAADMELDVVYYPRWTG